MDEIKKILILSILALFCINCSNNYKKKEKMEKEEIKELIITSSRWYAAKRQVWVDNYLSDEQPLKLNKESIKWISESGLFSQSFINNLNNETLSKNYKDFGLFFLPIELGEYLRVFCIENEKFTSNDIEKESENIFRYITYWGNVLSAIPDINEEEKGYWFFETGKNGERWQFSMVIIKENNKWVIDKIERHFAVVKGI